MIKLFKNNQIFKINLLSKHNIKKLKIKKSIQNIINTDLIKKNSANFSLQFPEIFRKKLTAPGKPVRGYEKYFNNKEIKFKYEPLGNNIEDLENTYILEKNSQLLNVKKYREYVSKKIFIDNGKTLYDINDGMAFKKIKSLNTGFDYAREFCFIKEKKNENDAIGYSSYKLKKTINLKNADTSLDATNHILFLKKNIWLKYIIYKIKKRKNSDLSKYDADYINLILFYYKKYYTTNVSYYVNNYFKLKPPFITTDGNNLWFVYEGSLFKLPNMVMGSAFWLFSKETYSNIKPAIPTFLALANPQKYNNKEYGFSKLNEDTFFNVGSDFFTKYYNFLNKNPDLYEKNNKNCFKKYLNYLHQSDMLKYSKLYNEIFFKNSKNSYLKNCIKKENLEKIKKYKSMKDNFKITNPKILFSEYIDSCKNLKSVDYFYLDTYIKKFNYSIFTKNNFVEYMFNYFQINQKNNTKLNNMVSEFIQQGTYSIKETNSTISFIFYYFIVLVILAIILFSLSKLLSKKEYSSEKKSPYECGFEPFMLLITAIEISFILVAFVFLIFDLELIFLIGFLVAFGTIGTRGIFYLMSYCLTVWIMIITEMITGILSWPIWVKYVYKSDSIN